MATSLKNHLQRHNASNLMKEGGNEKLEEIVGQLRQMSNATSVSLWESVGSKRDDRKAASQRLETTGEEKNQDVIPLGSNISMIDAMERRKARLENMDPGVRKILTISEELRRLSLEFLRGRDCCEVSISHLSGTTETTSPSCTSWENPNGSNSHLVRPIVENCKCLSTLEETVQKRDLYETASGETDIHSECSLNESHLRCDKPFSPSVEKRGEPDNASKVGDQNAVAFGHSQDVAKASYTTKESEPNATVSESSRQSVDVTNATGKGHTFSESETDRSLEHDILSKATKELRHVSQRWQSPIHRSSTEKRTSFAKPKVQTLHRLPERTINSVDDEANKGKLEYPTGEVSSQSQKRELKFRSPPRDSESRIIRDVSGDEYLPSARTETMNEDSLGQNPISFSQSKQELICPLRTNNSIDFGMTSNTQKSSLSFYDEETTACSLIGCRFVGQTPIDDDDDVSSLSGNLTKFNEMDSSSGQINDWCGQLGRSGHNAREDHQIEGSRNDLHRDSGGSDHDGASQHSESKRDALHGVMDGRDQSEGDAGKNTSCDDLGQSDHSRAQCHHLQANGQVPPYSSLESDCRSKQPSKDVPRGDSDGNDDDGMHTRQYLKASSNALCHDWDGRDRGGEHTNRNILREGSGRSDHDRAQSHNLKTERNAGRDVSGETDHEGRCNHHLAAKRKGRIKRRRQRVDRTFHKDRMSAFENGQNYQCHSTEHKTELKTETKPKRLGSRNDRNLETEKRYGKSGGTSGKSEKTSISLTKDIRKREIDRLLQERVNGKRAKSFVDAERSLELAYSKSTDGLYEYVRVCAMNYSETKTSCNAPCFKSHRHKSWAANRKRLKEQGPPKRSIEQRALDYGERCGVLSDTRKEITPKEERISDRRQLKSRGKKEGERKRAEDNIMCNLGQGFLSRDK